VIECDGVTCRQAEIHVVTSDATRDDTIKRNLDRAVDLLDFVAGGGQDRLGEKIFVEAFVEHSIGKNLPHVTGTYGLTGQ